MWQKTSRTNPWTLASEVCNPCEPEPCYWFEVASRTWLHAGVHVFTAKADAMGSGCYEPLVVDLIAECYLPTLEELLAARRARALARARR